MDADEINAILAYVRGKTFFDQLRYYLEHQKEIDGATLLKAAQVQRQAQLEQTIVAAQKELSVLTAASATVDVVDAVEVKADGADSVARL